MTLKVMSVFGTRPEAIKIAPIINALQDDPAFESIAVATGQHREMLDQVTEIFNVSTEHDLSIMGAGQSLNQIVSRVIAGIDDVLMTASPDIVLVQGDTSTVMGAAVASFNRNTPVVHLEAGLRSGDIESPFPEEANRKIATQISALHLAPTETSKLNLLREAVSESSVVVTGNTVIDALLYATSISKAEFENPVLKQLAYQQSSEPGRKILLVTAHRRENLGSAMDEIGAAVAELASRFPSLSVILPIHKNPRVRASLVPAVRDHKNIHLMEPLPYSEFTEALKLSDIVLTDSGGVQEEAPSLGKPVLVMRENTERPEAVLAGTVKLIGTKFQRIVDEVSLLLDSQVAYQAMANAVNPYGDGRAALRAVQAMKWKFLEGERPEDFIAK